MEDFCKYLGITRTLSVICCMFWIFSPAEGYNISMVVGRNVTLHCKKSNSTLSQLTWKMNGVNLVSFSPQQPLYRSTEAYRLNISITESHPDVLTIEHTQKKHTGNYTCETSTATGVEVQKWELIITEHEEAGNSKMLVIIVATTVPCVCCLTFILALTVLHICRKQRAGNHSPSAAMEREEDIYENCLETDVRPLRNYNQPHHYKPRTH